MNTVKCSNRSCDKEYSVQFDKCPFCGTPNPIEESERKAMIDSSTVINGSNGSGDDDKFNGWVTGMLWISIIYGGIRGFINCLTYFTISPVIGCLITGIHIFGIVVLCFILAAKKWAVFAWIGYIAAVVVCNGYFDNNDYLPYVAVGIFKLVFIFLVLQIKKNGVSAWSVIFNKQKAPIRNKETKIKKTKIGKSIFNRTPQSKKADNKKTIEPNNRKTEDDKTHINVSKVIADDIPPVSNNESKPIETPHTITPSEKQSNDGVYIPENKTKKNHSKSFNGKSIKTCIKNFKLWIYLLIVIAILAIVWLVVILINHPDKSELGEYIYVDGYNILHVDRSCDYIATNRGTSPITIYSLKDLDSRKWKQVCSHCVSDNDYKLICDYSIPSKRILPDGEPMSNNSKRNILYYNLLGSGKVTESEIGTLSEFKAAIKDEASTREFYANLINSGLFSVEEIGNEDDFYDSICSDFEQQDNLKILYETLKKDGVVKKDYDYFYKYLQNENNRQLLYNALKADNYDVPDSYESFRRTLFETGTSSR